MLAYLYRFSLNSSFYFRFSYTDLHNSNGRGGLEAGVGLTPPGKAWHRVGARCHFPFFLSTLTAERLHKWALTKPIPEETAFSLSPVGCRFCPKECLLLPCTPTQPLNTQLHYGNHPAGIPSSLHFLSSFPLGPLKGTNTRWAAVFLPGDCHLGESGHF